MENLRLMASSTTGSMHRLVSAGVFGSNPKGPFLIDLLVMEILKSYIKFDFDISLHLRYTYPIRFNGDQSC